MPININLNPNSEYHNQLIKSYGGDRSKALAALRHSRIIWDEKTVNALATYRSKARLKRETVR